MPGYLPFRAASSGVIPNYTVDGQPLLLGRDVEVVAPATHGAVGKTALLDADEFPVLDSAGSFGLEKVTWANLKAAVAANVVPWQGDTAGILPATSGQKLTTQGGNTLDDGSGNVVLKGGTLDGVTIGGITRALSVNTRALIGTNTLTMSGSTQNPWLSFQGAFAGSLTGGGSFNQLAFNDQVAGNDNYISGFQVKHNVIAPATGLRCAVNGNLLVSGTGSNDRLGASFVGVWGHASTASNVGGTGPGPNARGSFWGGWFQAVTTGGTYHDAVQGVEIDVNVQSSQIGMKVGLGITLLPTDAIRGTTEDTAIMIARESGGTTSWKTGLKLGTDLINEGGGTNPTTTHWAFASDSTLIGTSAANGTPLPAGTGIDLSQVACSDAGIKMGANALGFAPMSSAPSIGANAGRFYMAADKTVHWKTAAADSVIEVQSNKNQANGYAGLDGSGKVAAAQLPSYVDDVLDYSTLSAFPATGEAGKIYIADDTGFEYRWNTGTSAYIRIVASPGSTDAVAEGTTNLYFTNSRADARIAAAVGVTVQAYSANLTGFAAKTAPAGAVVGATDTQALTHKDLSDASNTFPTLNQSTTGNASTATKLATARKLNGVSFDGTADAVIPSNGFSPSDYNYLAWTFDPVLAYTTVAPAAAGQGFGMLIPIRQACTITSIVMHVGVAGAGLTSGQNFVALFDVNGNLLSTSADQSTNWQSAGPVVMPLATPQPVAAGYVYALFYVNGTTLPKFYYAPTMLAGVGAPPRLRGITDTTHTGLTTAFPSTLTPAGGSVYAWWIGLK